MAERGSMAKEADAASKLERLVEQLDTLEPVVVARALQDMHDNGLPSTVQQAVQLRNHNVVSTLVVLLEPTYDVTLRSHALHVIARMCKLDRMCQDSFINHGAARKLIKNSDTTLGREVDAPAAIRALACLVAGEETGPSQLAAVEDVFLSGLIARMHGELVARRLKPDDLLAAIAAFLSAVATCPANHLRLRDAALLPLLPGLLEATFGGAAAAAAAAGGAILDVVYQLSTSDAIAPSLRTELYFEALAGVLSAAPAMSAARRTALLAICNVFGPDADNVRAEEVLRVNGAPPLLTSLLAAALGPADVGAAARATGVTASVGGGAGAVGGFQRRCGGLGAGGARGMRASDGGMLGRARTSGSGGAAGGGAAAGDGLAGGGGGGGGGDSDWPTSRGPHDEAHAAGGRKGTKNGPALTSLTAPGFGGGGTGGTGKAPSRPSGDGVSADSAPVALEAILHSLKCLAANSMLARKLAKPGSPAYALPSLLDALVASLQHAAAGTLSRAALAARASAGAQTLLRLACCAELVPLLRAAGVPAVLRMLAVEADDPRVGEAACVALLYMGDTGLVGYTSRPAAAAFRALYRNGTTPAGSEPELGNRFQVFVSHHRADSHQFAMFTLYPLLVLQGVPAFVDPQHRTASSDWAHMIACCRNMVVVVSEMLLASPDHVREVEAAVAAGVNVVVVVPEGARWADSHGNKAFDSPPPAVLLALPASVRPLFAENTMPYASVRHVEFTQQLMSRLQLPVAASAADGAAETASPSVSPGREVGRLRGGGGGGGDGVGSTSMARRGSTSGMEGGARGRGRWTGRGDTQGGDDQQPPHRVSFTGVGDAFQRLQQQQDEEEREELEATAGAAAGPGSAAGSAAGQSALPWPWSKLLDGTMTIGSDDEDEVVRYPRNLFNNPGGGGDQLSGTLGRESATGMATGPLTAAPPPTGAPASYTSRRFTARQRSSINRQAAQALQQQQQFLVVQHQWVQEFQAQQQRAWAQQQQQSSMLLGSTGSCSPPPGQAGPTDDGGGGGEGSMRLPGVGLGGGLGDMAGLSPQLNQLLALQLELVRYELRQAVQASHDNIIYKIDRLRSDVTEQVVQLRFDLAGKLESIQEAMSKTGGGGGGCASAVGSAHDGTSPREAVDAASGGGGGGGSGSGGSNRDAVGGGGGGASPSPSQHQQLAAALSTSLAATLQDAVNRAVAQLQASVMAAGVPIKGGHSHQGVAAGPGVSQAVATNATVIAGSPAPLPKGHQGAVAMLAAAAQQQQAQQQQQLSPHPPPPPSNYARGANGGGGGVPVLAPTTPHLPQGMDMLSPVARAGAAAWGADLLGPTGGVASLPPGAAHGGGAKSRSSHAAVGPPNGAVAGGGGKAAGASGGGGGGASAAGTAGLPGRQGPGPLAMFDAAAAEDDAAGAGGGAGGGGGMDGRVMSPTSLLASVTSPATAQAALLLAGRTRNQAQAPAQGGGGMSGGTSLNNRNSSAHAAAAAVAAVATVGGTGAGGGAPGGGPSKGTLPPLAGLLPGFGPMSAAKLVERTDAMPVRKVQQQLLLTQQQASQHQFA